MRLLVTGGTGFLGGALVRRALQAGHEVAVLSRGAGAPGGSGVTWIHGTLAEPPWGEMGRFAPEVVVHAAWLTTPGVYLESPENDDWLRWSVALAGGLASVGVRRLVALGTCIEYAVTGAPLREDATPLDPKSRYARAKVALHGRLRELLGGSGVGLAWARIFYPYGLHEHPARLASSLLARIRSGEMLRLRTPRSTKDYIHEDDVGTALLALAGAGAEGAFNVGTGTGVTVEELAGVVAWLGGRPDLVGVDEGAAVVPDPLDHVVADVGRLRGLGWEPRVSLVDGLRRLVESRPT